MASRAPRILTLLACVVVFVLAYAGWRTAREPAVGPDVVANGKPDPSSERPITVPTEAESSAPLAARAVGPGDLESPSEQETRSAPEDRGVTAGSDPLWIEGTVIFPEGTAKDERVEVSVTRGVLREAKGTPAIVDSSGRFRVEVPRGKGDGQLQLEAPHLFLDPPESVSLKKGGASSEVVLRPKLGACLVGRLVPPAGAESSAKDLEHDYVTVQARPIAGREDATATWRYAQVDEKFGFQANGLDPDCEHRLSFALSKFLVPATEALRVSPGETRVVEIPLVRGVLLSGRVIPPPGRTLIAPRVRVRMSGADFTETTDLPPRAMFAETSADGTFAFRALPPGDITLLASASGFIETKLELGWLANGAVREDIELYLGMGGVLAGRVAWPDGTPAIDAEVLVVPTGIADDPRDLGRSADVGVRKVDEQGRFTIEGLRSTSFDLIAVATPPRKSTKVRKSAPWQTRLDAVPAGSLSLELVLQPGTTIHGRVVDDAGAPVDRFSVRVVPDPCLFEQTLARSKSVRARDGNFSIEGVQPGTHRLEVFNLRHENPPPLRLVLPGDTGPFTLVARRLATIRGVVTGSPDLLAHRPWVFAEGIGNLSRKGKRVDDTGAFELPGIEAGRIDLFVNVEGVPGSEPLELDVLPGQTIEGLRLRLHRPARITGRVHASAPGDPIGGRRILGTGDRRGARFEALTDSQGRFEVSNVAPGAYSVALMPPESESPSKGYPSVEEAALDVLYVTPTPACETRVTVGEAAVVHVEFGFEALGKFPVRGTVRHGGTARPGVRIRAWATDAEDTRDAVTARTDANGAFELLVREPGNYTLQALADDRPRRLVETTIEVGPHGAQPVDLEVPAGRIHVTLRMPQASPGQYWIVQVAGGPNGGWGQPVREDESGSNQTSFEELPYGRYTISAKLYAPEESGRIIETVVELSPGSASADVSLQCTRH